MASMTQLMGNSREAPEKPLYEGGLVLAGDAGRVSRSAKLAGGGVGTSPAECSRVIVKRKPTRGALEGGSCLTDQKSRYLPRATVCCGWFFVLHFGLLTWLLWWRR